MLRTSDSVKTMLRASDSVQTMLRTSDSVQTILRTSDSIQTMLRTSDSDALNRCRSVNVSKLQCQLHLSLVTLSWTR